MTVCNQLTGRRSGRRDSHTENDVVQTALQQDQQVLTLTTLHGGSFLEQVVELTLQYSVSIFDFLFFFQLNAVFRGFFTFLQHPVLSGRMVLSFKIFIRPVNRFSEFTCNFGLWACISCHLLSVLVINNYTLRRPLGRHPLWGSGVTSTISVTSIPAPWIVRMADSRPDPGPLT